MERKGGEVKKHHWIKNWMAGEWGGWRCALCREGSFNPPDIEPGEMGCSGSKLSQRDKDVLDVLRRHQRALSTIAWGVLQYSGDAVPEFEILETLQSLEMRGLALEAPISDRGTLHECGVWWTITDKGESHQTPYLEKLERRKPQ